MAKEGAAPIGFAEAAGEASASPGRLDAAVLLASGLQHGNAPVPADGATGGGALNHDRPRPQGMQMMVSG